MIYEHIDLDLSKVREKIEVIIKDSKEAHAKLVQLTEENNKLRGILAWSAAPCIYCNLPLGDQSKCASGFPGCARVDDQMVYNPNEVKYNGLGNRV